MTEAIFQRGGHVAHVQVAGSGDEQYSTTTSGIYSVEGSEGSNSPEYNRFRSRVTVQDVSANKRWSVGFSEDNKHVARLVVGVEPKGSENDRDFPIHNHSVISQHTPSMQIQGQTGNLQNVVVNKYMKEGIMHTEPFCEKLPREVERSNSRVTRVSNLIKWPRKHDKGKNDYVQI